MKCFWRVALIVLSTRIASTEQVNITTVLVAVNILQQPSGSNYDGEAIRDLVIGGSLASSQEYRSYAVTDPVDNAGGLCGATLIHPDILISAAHCGVGGIFNNGVLMNIGGTSIYGEDAIDRIEIVGQLIHPEYDSDSITNDVMLIKLSSPSLAPPSTWNTDDLIPQNSELLTIIGHGKTESGSASQFLLEATVFVVDNDVCETAYAQSAGSTIDSDVVICAASEESTTCSGDSGGPLFREGLLVGIVSFGIVSEFDGSCISAFPSGFTRVSAFSDFIKKSICTLSASPPDSCFASTNIPVPALTSTPTSRPPTQAPTTLIPTFPPLQYMISFTPFTPVPTISPTTLAPASLSPTPFPSIKVSHEPTTIPSYKPSSKPTYQPSNFPTANPSDVISIFPSSAPNVRVARSSDKNGNASSTVIAIEGENRGFGIDVQSSAGSYRNQFNSYNYFAMVILLHGIATIIYL